jgi:hypothetical protein
MPTQNDIARCWLNADNSEDDYIIPVRSKSQAIAFRAQAHAFRRKIAEKMFRDVIGDYTDHPFYKLEVLIEERRGQYYIIFTRKGRLILPPPTKLGDPSPLDEPLARGSLDDTPKKIEWPDDQS